MQIAARRKAAAGLATPRDFLRAIGCGEGERVGGLKIAVRRAA
jgi:hypothetical protein